MKLTKYEQETIIIFNNDEQEASIYTASPQMMRKLDALAAAYPEHYRVVGQTEVSKTYSCEKHLINLRKPRKQNEDCLLYTSWKNKSRFVYADYFGMLFSIWIFYNNSSLYWR